MASKKTIKTIIKLQCPAGKATPAPPVGTALGPQGLNIMEFVTKFNDATRALGNTIIPVEITVYEDRTFDLEFKQPPAAILIKEALGIKSGAANVRKETVGTLTHDQVRAIAEKKFPDLSARTIEEAEKVILGTARSMGVNVEA
jgi:large subunit ribosomal protein L11